MGSSELDKILLYSLTRASLRRISGGAILLSTGSQGRGVGIKVPLTVLITLLSCLSTLLVCTLFNHTGAQYSAAEKTRDSADVRRTCALAPQDDPARCCTRFALVLTFPAAFSKWLLNVSARSKVTPRY